MQLSEQEIIRREKLGKLRELGINPYPANLFPVNHTSKQVKETFEEGKKVIVAGRVMSTRIQGKASFASLQDKFENLFLVSDLSRCRASHTDTGQIIRVTGFMLFLEGPEQHPGESQDAGYDTDDEYRMQLLENAENDNQSHH